MGALIEALMMHELLEAAAERIQASDSTKWTAREHELDWEDQSIQQINPLKIQGFKNKKEADGWLAQEIAYMDLDMGTVEKNYFEELKQDIKANGIQDPLMLVEDGGKFFIVDGWHRLAIAIILGMKTVPAVFGKRRA